MCEIGMDSKPTTETITILEFDEDGEVAGKRSVQLEAPLVPLASIPEHIDWLQIEDTARFEFIDEICLEWFQPEAWPDYEMTNRSRFYLSFQVGTNVPGKNEYDAAWVLFREQGIERLCQRLGFSSWGFGKGVVDKRGQDIFVVELAGFDHPGWLLCVTVLPGQTWLDCLALAESIDKFVGEELIPSIKEAVE